MPFAKVILNSVKSSLLIVVPSVVPDGGLSMPITDVMFSDNVILDPEILATVMFGGSITPETNTLSPTLIPSVFEIVITFAVALASLIILTGSLPTLLESNATCFTSIGIYESSVHMYIPGVTGVNILFSIAVGSTTEQVYYWIQHFQLF